MNICDGAYPCIILHHERRDVDLLRFDAGEELLQVVQVADFVLHPRHTEGGEEPRRNLGRDVTNGEGERESERESKKETLNYGWCLIWI